MWRFLVRRWITIITLICIAGLAAGCGSSGKCKRASDALFGPPKVGQAVVVASPEDKTLRCADTMVPVEIAVGTQTARGSEYSIVEQQGPVSGYSTPDGDTMQVGVKVHVQPPAHTAVLGAIVHTAGSNDQELALRIPAGGVADMVLKTAKYALLADHLDKYPINSVVLCTEATG
jgi:hypothetical protein